MNSGGTLKAAQFLSEKGAKKIIAAVVQVDSINNSPIDLIITDSIPLTGKEKDCNKKISLLSVSDLFAQAIRRIHNGDKEIF